MKKIAIVTMAFFALGLSQMNAQSDYIFSGGLGSDVSSYRALVGPSAKYFFSEVSAVQAEAMFESGITALTGLYEFHGNIEGVDGLKWFAGAGASVLFYSNGYDNQLINNGSSTQFAFRPVGGAEYKLNTIPLAFTFDWRPFIELNDSYSGNQIASFGLGARYVIK